MRGAIFLLFSIIAIISISCRKIPDLRQLSANFVVATNYDQTVNFTNYKTFYISDTIASISGSPTDTIWFDANAKQLVNAVKQNMLARGFQFVAKSSHPDIGMNMAVVKNINVGAVYPGWEWGYPGWWDPWYWGWYYPYYYPWSVTYEVTTGTIGIDMIDLKNAGVARQRLAVIWSAVMGGALGYGSSDLQNGINSINQAFIQTPNLVTR